MFGHFGVCNSPTNTNYTFLLARVGLFVERANIALHLLNELFENELIVHTWMNIRLKWFLDNDITITEWFITSNSIS